MRGKGKAERTLMGRDGITPAYAGKSSGWRWVITISQDHPRLCGEKFKNSFSVKSCRGITPAYAGKR